MFYMQTEQGRELHYNAEKAPLITGFLLLLHASLALAVQGGHKGRLQAVCQRFC